MPRAKKGTWTGSSAQQEDCALQLIRFVRGMDVFDYDGDGNITEERPCADNARHETKSCKLADIFHSTPVTVEPPVEPFVCSLGLSGQCAVHALRRLLHHRDVRAPVRLGLGAASPATRRRP